MGLSRLLNRMGGIMEQGRDEKGVRQDAGDDVGGIELWWNV